MSLAERIQVELQNERRFVALTGVSPEKFIQMLHYFEVQVEKRKFLEFKQNQKRRRKPGGGAKGHLVTPQEKLFFILYYFKNYDGNDAIGFTFNMSSSSANDNVELIFPLFLKTLKAMGVLPYRSFNTLKKFSQVTENHRKIIFDATERPIPRHVNNARQKQYYSGKKKRHMVKNLVGIESGGGILYVGPTAPGRTHDYTLFKRGFDKNIDWFQNVEIKVDLGFQGIKTDYKSPENISIPFKKPRKSKNNPNPSLTRMERRYNRLLARERIIVEHVFGRMKIFRILTDRIRSRSKKFLDEVFLALAGLHNFKKGFIVP